MIAAGMRVIEWAFAREPYRRLSLKKAPPKVPNGHSNGSANGPASSSNGNANGHTDVPSAKTSDPILLSTALWDAVDLSFNLRGIGWNWANDWYFPRETRNTDSTPAFLWGTIVSALKHFAVIDITLSSLRHFLPTNAGTSVGAPIYDYSLSPIPRYTISSILSFTGGITLYATMQFAYDVFTICGIVLLRQQPSQWPTLFDSPWLSTSLAECWAKRWHQVRPSTSSFALRLTYSPLRSSVAPSSASARNLSP